MVFGIGTDLVEVSRIQFSIQKGDGFKKLVFSEHEVSYCESQSKPFESYAARFAAKGAFLKALGTGWAGKVSLHEIEVQNDGLGKPILVLKGEAEKIFKEMNLLSVHLSLSHIKEIATATVVVES